MRFCCLILFLIAGFGVSATPPSDSCAENLGGSQHAQTAAPAAIQSWAEAMNIPAAQSVEVGYGGGLQALRTLFENASKEGEGAVDSTILVHPTVLGTSAEVLNVLHRREIAHARHAQFAAAPVTLHFEIPAGRLRATEKSFEAAFAAADLSEARHFRLYILNGMFEVADFIEAETFAELQSNLR